MFHQRLQGFFFISVRRDSVQDYYKVNEAIIKVHGDVTNLPIVLICPCKVFFPPITERCLIASQRIVQGQSMFYVNSSAGSLYTVLNISE